MALYIRDMQCLTAYVFYKLTHDYTCFHSHQIVSAILIFDSLYSHLDWLLLFKLIVEIGWVLLLIEMLMVLLLLVMVLVILLCYWTSAIKYDFFFSFFFPFFFSFTLSHFLFKLFTLIKTLVSIYTIILCILCIWWFISYSHLFHSPSFLFFYF